MLVAFALRTDTELTVQRDRNPNFVRLSNGDIRNSYAVKVLNKRQTPQHVRLDIDGLPSAQLGFVGADVEGSAWRGPMVLLAGVARGREFRLCAIVARALDLAQSRAVHG